MSNGFVYALIDPRTQGFCYVGQTRKQRVEMRLFEHLGAPPSRAMRDWILELKELGLRPQIQVLEQVPIEQLSVREYFWITELLHQGHPLLNKFTDDWSGGHKSTTLRLPVTLRARIEDMMPGRSLNSAIVALLLEGIKEFGED